MACRPCIFDITWHTSHVISNMAVFQYSILHGIEPYNIEYTWWCARYIWYYMVGCIRYYMAFKPCIFDSTWHASHVISNMAISRFSHIGYYMIRKPWNIEYLKIWFFWYLMLHGSMPCNIKYTWQCFMYIRFYMDFGHIISNIHDSVSCIFDFTWSMAM